MADFDITQMANSLYAATKRKDDELNDLFKKVLDNIESLDNMDVPLNVKYNTVISTEYLYFKLRNLVENEHILVKQVLQDKNTSVYIKEMFSKRDTYLAQVSAKLTTIQNDISIIQKLNYSLQFNHS